jgi:membrane protein YdbS with pleckstrin-like domain
MAAPLSSAAEFQRRRKATWRAIRWWLLVAVASVLSMAAMSIRYDDAFESEYLRAASSLFLIVVICGVAIAIQVRRLYRCPRCRSIPIRTAYGWRDEFGKEARDVEWNPSSCPTCHAPLR